jgi:hypothetical protein
MYGLKRGRQWLSAGGPVINGLVPEVIVLADDSRDAWLSPTLDDALERRTLLQMAFGLTTEVRAIR